MIFIHLSVNDGLALLDENNILFAEQLEGKDNDDKDIKFTRIYLKQPIPNGEEETSWLDIRESVEKLAKLIK